MPESGRNAAGIHNTASPGYADTRHNKEGATLEVEAEVRAWRSTLANLIHWIEALEFDPCVGGREMPVDPLARDVARHIPRNRLLAQRG